METGYLRHVFEIFQKLGYLIVNGSNEDWDVLWSHDYPFSRFIFSPLKDHQKVSHSSLIKTIIITLVSLFR